MSRLLRRSSLTGRRGVNGASPGSPLIDIRSTSPSIHDWRFITLAGFSRCDSQSGPLNSTCSVFLTLRSSNHSTRAEVSNISQHCSKSTKNEVTGPMKNDSRPFSLSATLHNQSGNRLTSKFFALSSNFY